MTRVETGSQELVWRLISWNNIWDRCVFYLWRI